MKSNNKNEKCCVAGVILAIVSFAVSQGIMYVQVKKSL